MPKPDSCLICKATADVQGDFPTGDFIVDCPSCGRYRADRMAGFSLQQSTPRPVGRLRGWIYRQALLGESARFTQEVLDRLGAAPDLPLSEKADRLLFELVRDRPYPPDTITLLGHQLLGSIEASSERELAWVCGILEERHLVELEKTMGNAHARVTQQGYVRAEEYRDSSVDSAQAFVAMWFDPSMSDAWTNGFSVGISRAGWNPFRVDRHEHVNRVDDEIVAQIRRSRFLVADFTGLRGGVYFEAGFCYGLHRTVIWTCKKSQFDSDDKPHFDVNHFNFIVWETPDDLAVQLRLRIEHVIGQGPRPAE